MPARARRAAIAIALALGATAPATAAAVDAIGTGTTILPPAGAPDVVDDPPPNPEEGVGPRTTKVSTTTAPGSTAVPGSTAAPGSTTAPASTTVPGTTAPRRRGATVTGRGVGVARLQTPASKWHEAVVSCHHRPAQTSTLLGVPGSASERGHGWLTLTIVAITAAAGAVLLIAFLTRRLTARDTSRPTTFELVAGSITILGTVAGLATAFIPGVGVRERPAPQVTMTVREVHARIIHAVYDAAIGRHVVTDPELTRERLENRGSMRPADHAAALDGLEIGNVAWLELHFSGYGGQTLRLQSALFRPGAGASFIQGSDDEHEIEVDDGDESAKFVPVWFGAPRLPQFRAEFRVLDDGKVVQMASTATMRGRAYRYACPDER